MCIQVLCSIDQVKVDVSYELVFSVMQPGPSNIILYETPI